MATSHPVSPLTPLSPGQVDRSVTGLVAQQQCVGPLHTPLADVAVVALSHFDTVGAATALGEQPIKGLLDPAAGARLALTEALTNLVFARITDLRVSPGPPHRCHGAAGRSDVALGWPWDGWATTRPWCGCGWPHRSATSHPWTCHCRVPATPAPCHGSETGLGGQGTLMAVAAGTTV